MGRQRSELGPIKLTKWQNLLFIWPQSAILPHWLLTTKAVKRNLMRDLNPKCKDENTLDKSCNKKHSCLRSKGIPSASQTTPPKVRSAVARGAKVPTHRAPLRYKDPPPSNSPTWNKLSQICGESVLWSQFQSYWWANYHLILFVLCTFGVMR